MPASSVGLQEHRQCSLLFIFNPRAVDYPILTMTDSVDPVPSNSSKGKEKISKTGPLGVKSGTEQLVPSKLGNPSRPHDPSPADESLPRPVYASLVDAQKIVFLQDAIVREREAHRQALEATNGRVLLLQQQLNTLSTQTLGPSPMPEPVLTPTSTPAPVDKAILACIVAAALATVTAAGTSLKKAREPVYSSLNFVDPVELERNDIIPAIVDRTIE